jgi:hypothetical protein
MRKFYLPFCIAVANLLVIQTLQAQNTCASCSASNQVNFNWSTAVGSGNEFGGFASYGTQTKNFTVNAVDITTTITDPSSRLTVTNYQTNPLISARGPYTFCFTRTNGSLGNPPGAQSLYSGFFQLGMFSLNSSEVTTLEYIFSEPVLLCNLEISDIDYDGEGSVAADGPYKTYQDEVTVSASTGAGNVPITITKATNAFGDEADVTVTGQNIVANYLPNVFGDVPANSFLGKVFLSSADPITRLVITYSNGPADDGTSNDHHIRIGNLTACKSPTTLPVRIVDFNGRENNGQALLNLVVAEQSGILSYDLQRSADGRNFTTVTSQLATNSNQYSFTDATPANGANFYRIQVKERNGETSFSRIVRVDLLNKLGFSVKSQGSQVILQANTEASKRINVAIFNSGGTQVGTQEFRLNRGVNLLNLDQMNAQASGIYFIVVSENGQRVFNTKVVK